MRMATRRSATESRLAGSDHPVPAPPALRVLLAEDDDAARSLLADLLRSFGHEVVATVASGRAAVEQSRLTIPDVALLDVHMPDGSGVEAATAIARAVPGIAVVLITGDPSVTLSADDVLGTAALAFLSKPVSPSALDASVRLASSRARELAAARGEAASARESLEQRKVIERAKGLLMRRTGSTEQEAYRILQRTSQDRAVPMVEIARAVLASEPGQDGLAR